MRSWARRAQRVHLGHVAWAAARARGASHVPGVLRRFPPRPGNNRVARCRETRRSDSVRRTPTTARRARAGGTAASQTPSKKADVPSEITRWGNPATRASSRGWIGTTTGGQLRYDHAHASSSSPVSAPGVSCSSTSPPRKGEQGIQRLVALPIARRATHRPAILRATRGSPDRPGRQPGSDTAQRAHGRLGLSARPMPARSPRPVLGVATRLRAIDEHAVAIKGRLGSKSPRRQRRGSTRAGTVGPSSDTTAQRAPNVGGPPPGCAGPTTLPWPARRAPRARTEGPRAALRRPSSLSVCVGASRLTQSGLGGRPQTEGGRGDECIRSASLAQSSGSTNILELTPGKRRGGRGLQRACRKQRRSMLPRAWPAR